MIRQKLVLAFGVALAVKADLGITPVNSIFNFGFAIKTG